MNETTTGKLVFFDLDGTVLSGLSSENAFFLHLLKLGYIRTKQILYTLLFILKWFYKYKLHVFIKNKAYLTDLSVDQISAIGHHFVKKNLLKNIRVALEKRILEHQKANDIVILLTGSYDFLAKIFAEYLNIDHIEATECISQNNRFTNKPPRKHPFEIEKLHIAQKLCEKYHIPLENCAAYGNSRNDIILLSKVGHPVAVHPDRKLRRIAREKGWEIVE